ncbi:ATP-binding protein [Galactobacter valiniphilus]|uniref:ATP-binding protein n=1 Tax=Galactobacter valiniphilus TaxID=2676122 RepID=A0A399J8E0_9MICC|nr:YifB family Mg chelatase-like AAA ATPase [Galactobacter valiniphilus]RII41788.1 ATP-binding protein [Galactobacter valiniphilus]
MSLGVSHTVALNGLTGTPVRVEADLGGGLPGMILLGLPDASLGEARDRVRSAARNTGIALSARRLTVNLVPAGLPKRGPAFDLAILVACLAAQAELASPQDTVFLGELGLDGALRPVAGVLPCLLAAREAGFARAVLPRGNAEEAALVPGLETLAYARAADVLAALGASERLLAAAPAVSSAEAEAGAGGADGAPRGPDDNAAGRVPDLAEVVGQPYGRYVLEVAAAGGHHLLLSGPPGAGKTMLAERLPGILPPLSEEDALLSACLRSVGGWGVRELVRTPPFLAPHHTSTTPSLVGGGSGVPRPGAASLAHGGVLFLDEAPEFAARTLDALREPLESGRLTLHRSGGSASYPAQFQLILAANPCPCGKPGRDCECSALVRRRYWARLSGPLLDRIDLRAEVPAAQTAAIVSGAWGEDSALVRERVAAARALQERRWGGRGGNTNARVPGRVLRERPFAPSGREAAALRDAADLHGLTGRGVERVLRIAWTLADLAEAERPTAEHLEQAALLRGEAA